jgi:adenosylcobyric acid synthase
MSESFDDLASEHELVVIEGAGSPAEINLRDQVNNRMIDHADAAGLLVSDIDRGGSFAHLFGTWSLVPDVTRERLDGFVLNRFRGDPTLLAPGPQRLTEMTGMAAAGVMPMLRHELPREEGGAEQSTAPADAPLVVIPRFPFGSNLDEFHLLGTAARVRWVDRPSGLDDLDPTRDLVILPGSKHVASDLDWLRERGLADAVAAAVRRGVRVVGVCGGAMMLGTTIEDPDGVEGGRPWSRHGLGLLDANTRLGGNKQVVATEVDVFGGRFSGYEIRFGELDDARQVIERGDVVATTVHGLFEHGDVMEHLLGVRPTRGLDDTFELLADAVEAHLDTSLLRSLVGLSDQISS